MVEGSNCCTFGPQVNIDKAFPFDRSAWPSDLQTQVPPAGLSFCRAGRGDLYRPGTVPLMNSSTFYVRKNVWPMGSAANWASPSQSPQRTVTSILERRTSPNG